MSEVALRTYLDKIEKDYRQGIATEHSYRGTLKELLEALGAGITATNEPKRIKCGAPDYVIGRDTSTTALTIGYVEAKNIGEPLDKIERDEQLGRYRNSLENLILTDYLEFRWYVNGEKRMTARLATSRPDKQLSFEKDGARAVADLLLNFLGRHPEPIRKPQDLAKRMARLAHMIRAIVVEAFEKKEVSPTILDLCRSFQEVLLPEMTDAEFADMFAQTLAYGLFAARYNHKGRKPFSRDDAAREIPRANPFLRKLFGTIAGPDLDDEPFVGFVDELAQVLAFTEMDAVLADFGKRTRQEDPIVHFYETFLIQYDSKLRELRGVYYTPEPVVSYIVRSVDALLRAYFDCPEGVADTSTISHTYVDESGETHTQTSPYVLLLDPACGTGTFLYAVINLIRDGYLKMGNAGMWSGYVHEHLLPRLFGFELLMAPYAMAHLKIGMQLASLDLPPSERHSWAYEFRTDERLGLYLTNTLEEALKRSEVVFGRYISDEANEAAKVKQNSPVMVIFGNPPYSGHSANKGPWISNLLHGKETKSEQKTGNYFAVDGKPLKERNPKYLNDDYVKFMRFAQWRIEQTGYGILAFITNHGYLDNATFRGMRQSLMQSFDDIFILDLHGNSKKREQPPDGSKDENVFDIQQGVAIGIFVKRKGKQSEPDTPHNATVRHAQLWGPREVYEKSSERRRLVGGKYHWLAEHDCTTTQWTTLQPRAPLYLFKPQDTTLKSEYENGWEIKDILPVYSTGVKTHRDHFVTDFELSSLHKRIEDFRNLFIKDETIAEQYELQDTRDWKLSTKRQSLAANTDWESFFTKCLYRPFDIRDYYHYADIVEFPRNEVMQHMLAGYNVGIATTRAVEIGRGWEHILCSNKVIQHHTVSLKETNYFFPLYLYPDSKVPQETNQPANGPGKRTHNLSTGFIDHITALVGMTFEPDDRGNLWTTFGPEDILHYMYAVFHSPMYRERYAEFLKVDFPRLPLTSNEGLFRALCQLGERLVGLHLMEERGAITTRFPEAGNNIVEKVEYAQPADNPERGRVWINKTQYFEGVPPVVWNFSIGGYQVCQRWLKDRKGRALSFADMKHYQLVVAALAETLTLMEKIDKVIDEYGGWPLV